jgi:hypothetical protein
LNPISILYIGIRATADERTAGKKADSSNATASTPTIAGPSVQASASVPASAIESQTQEATRQPVLICPTTSVDAAGNDCLPNSVKSLQNKSGIRKMEEFFTNLNVDLAPFAKEFVNNKRGEALAQEIRRIQVNFKVLKKQALASRAKGANLSQAEKNQFATRAAQVPSDVELQQLVDALPEPSEEKNKVALVVPRVGSNDPEAPSSDGGRVTIAELGMPEAKFWAVQDYLSEKQTKADKVYWLKTGLGPDGEPLTFDDLPADDFFDKDNQVDSNASDDEVDYYYLSRTLAAFEEHSARNEVEQEAEFRIFKIASEESAAYNQNKWLLKLIFLHAQKYFLNGKYVMGRFNFHPEYNYPRTPTELELAFGLCSTENNYLKDDRGQCILNKQIQDVTMRLVWHVQDMLKCCKYGTKASPEQLAAYLETLPATVRVKNEVLKKDVYSTDNHVRYVTGKANSENYAKFKREFLECREELIKEFEAIGIWEEEFESHDNQAARFIVEQQFPAIDFCNVTTKCTVWNAVIHE